MYAEDPANGWQPQALLTVHRFEVPGAPGLPAHVLGSGSTPASSTDRRVGVLRPDAGQGHPTRRPAVRPPGISADALARTRIHGVRTNRDPLVNVLRHPAFLDGATDTAFFDTHGLAELAAPLSDPHTVRLAALAAALADAAQNRRSATVFAAADGMAQPRIGLPDQAVPDTAGEVHDVSYRFTRDRVEVPGMTP